MWWPASRFRPGPPRNPENGLDVELAAMRRRRTAVSWAEPIHRLFRPMKRGIMNKNDLVEHLAQEYELTKTFARDVVDNVFQTITDAVQKGEEVSIFGFGKFKLVERKARKGRNPQTGEAIKIAASKNVKFEQASAMKALVNTKRRGRK
jgi:DNA-binding protein HU-beta